MSETIKNFETFLNETSKINEEKVKHETDNSFIQKIITTLDKAGYKVTFDNTKGYLTITGGDDEKVNFEYFY